MTVGVTARVGVTPAGSITCEHESWMDWNPHVLHQNVQPFSPLPGQTHLF